MFLFSYTSAEDRQTNLFIKTWKNAFIPLFVLHFNNIFS